MRTPRIKRVAADQDTLKQAEQFGREAFAQGKRCIPALDTNRLAPLYRANKLEATISIMDAWATGWTKAHLAVPILGMPEFVSVWA